jgi:hypothetical protein
MKPLKDPSKLSDRELSAMLKSLREDVAAPAQFRGQVLQRLAEKGIVPKAPAAAQPSWLQRFAAQFSAPRLGLAAGAACALALVLFNSPTPSTVVEPVLSEGAAPSAIPARAEGQKKSQVASHKRKAIVDGAMVADAAVAPAAPAAAPQEQELKSEAVVVAEASVAEDAPAIGSAPAPQVSRAMALASAAPAGASQAPQFSAGSAAVPAAPGVQAASVTKPEIIVVVPSPTPMVKGLKGLSEVRNSLVRASRGEKAIVIVKVESPGNVRVEIHDRLGRTVAVLKDATLGVGIYSLPWAGTADEGGMAASGIYEVSIQAPGYSARHKIGLVK